MVAQYIRFVFALGSIAPIFGITSISLAEAPSGEAASRLVATTFQDELRRLPADNTVLFTAATRSVSIRLDALDQLDSSLLAGTKLVVVDSNGDKRNFTADDEGVVTIDNVTAGPHAIVANNDEAHGSTLLVFEEEQKKAEANIFDLNAEPDPAAEPAPRPVGKGRMTLVKMKSQELIPIIDKYLTPSGEREGNVAASDFEARGSGRQSAFQIRIGANGQLDGIVISMLKTGRRGNDVAGTNLTLFSDGTRVGGATADASGRFTINDVTPGTYGIIAAGPAGYAAFGFDLIALEGVVHVSPSHKALDEYRFVSTLAFQEQGNMSDLLPVVLIPPTFVPEVVQSIRTYYPPIAANGVGPLGGNSMVPGLGGMAGGGGAS